MHNSRFNGTYRPEGGDGDGDGGVKTWQMNVSGEVLNVTITTTDTAVPIGINKDFNETHSPSGGTILWSVTNGTGEATINSTSGVLKGTKAGTVTVKVKYTKDGKFVEKTKEVKVVEVASIIPEEGVEIDDGDDDDNTKEYVVAIAESGTVTVNAKSNPELTATELPTGWSLTSSPNNTGSDKLQRTIDKTTAGTTEFTCTCGTSEKKLKVHVVEIVKVEWLKPEDENLLTDVNAHPSGPVGVRWFPGATDPDEEWNEKVKLKVTINPAIEGVTVHLKEFDPDDPSANNQDNPVDDDTDGGDNRGRRGNCQETSGETNEDGIFITKFRVSRNPGDNHRVAALPVESDDFDLLNDNNVPGSNDQPDISAFKGKVSKLLTVWRKLHYEVDTMVSPAFTDNTWSGIWLDPVPEGTNLVWIEYEVTGDPSEENIYGADDYWYCGGAKICPTSYAGIIASERNFFSRNRIKIYSSYLGDMTSGTIVLGDDDFYNDELIGTVPATFQAGAQGTSRPIVSPSTSSKNIVINAYKEAYINVLFESQHSDYYTFDCWSTNGNPYTAAALIEDYDDKQDLSREEKYWTVTSVILFQPNEDYDNDPHGEDMIVGATSPTVYNDMSVVFSESCHEVSSSTSEYAIRIGQNLAHESCHCYAGTSHSSSGLMTSEVPAIGVTSFSPETLNLIRSAE